MHALLALQIAFWLGFLWCILLSDHLSGLRRVQYSPWRAIASSRWRGDTTINKEKTHPATETSSVGSAERGSSIHELNEVKGREKRILAESLPHACFKMLNNKREFSQPFPETYWYKNICPIKFPLIFKFCHAEIRAFCTKSVFSLPLFFPAYNRWFFYFSWRIWLHPALAGAQLGAKLTPPSSAVASHHHLPGKNWHPCKSPAVNPSADCSLTWFSQTHQVQLKHVNIHLSKAPTQCWSRPGSCQPQPFPPLSPYLPTGDQHVLGSACHFNCWVWGFFNTINFRVLGMQYSSRKKLVQNKNKGRRTTSGQRVEQASW